MQQDRLTVRLNAADVENLSAVAAALNPSGRRFIDKAETIRTGLLVAAHLVREGALEAVLHDANAAQRP